MYNLRMPNITMFESQEARNQWYREYRAKNREKLRDYNRSYNKQWRKKNGLHSEKKYKLKYPEKALAQRLLQSAIRSGKIVRGNCEVCNLPNAQGHHDDYFKPLDVRWLCPLHHSQHHRNIQKNNCG